MSICTFVPAQQSKQTEHLQQVQAPSQAVDLLTLRVQQGGSAQTDVDGFIPALVPAAGAELTCFTGTKLRMLTLLLLLAQHAQFLRRRRRGGEEGERPSSGAVGQSTCPCVQVWIFAVAWHRVKQ